MILKTIRHTWTRICNRLPFPQLAAIRFSFPLIGATDVRAVHFQCMGTFIMCAWAGQLQILCTKSLGGLYPFDNDRLERFGNKLPSSGGSSDATAKDDGSADDRKLSALEFGYVKEKIMILVPGHATSAHLAATSMRVQTLTSS